MSLQFSFSCGSRGKKKNKSLWPIILSTPDVPLSIMMFYVCIHVKVLISVKHCNVLKKKLWSTEKYLIQEYSLIIHTNTQTHTHIYLLYICMFVYI